MRQRKGETRSERCDYVSRVDWWQRRPSSTPLNRLFLYCIWIFHLLTSHLWLHWVEYHVSTGLYIRFKSWGIKKRPMVLRTVIWEQFVKEIRLWLETNGSGNTSWTKIHPKSVRWDLKKKPDLFLLHMRSVRLHSLASCLFSGSAD